MIFRVNIKCEMNILTQTSAWQFTKPELSLTSFWFIPIQKNVMFLADVLCSKCSTMVQQTLCKKCSNCEMKIICFKCIVDGNPREGPICSDCLLQMKDMLWLYLDNSNLWIQSKKLRSKKMNLKSKEDHRVRIKFGELITSIQKLRQMNNRREGKVAQCCFYGSKPPDTDSIWKMAEQQGWKPSIKDRGMKGEEKEVDTEIVADVTELVSEHVGGTIILITGDRDMRPCVTKAHAKNWNVEVYMWKHAASKEFSDMEIFFDLGPEFVNITFPEWEYKEQVVKKGFGMDISSIDEGDEEIEKFYLRIESIVRLPLQYKIDKKYHKMLQVVLPRCKAAEITDAIAAIQNNTKAKCYTLSEYEEVLKDKEEGFTRYHAKRSHKSKNS